MRKILPIQGIGLFLTLLSLSTAAQQKSFSFEQAFEGSATGISKPLPEIDGWADDSHYLETRKDESDGSMKIFSVNVRNGKAEVYRGTNAPPAFLPTISITDAKNITLSPDGKWAAYTKDNNLYALEIATARTIQFTHDGCDTIMNGYSSWVYNEEILGRPTHYRAFWWSPDSKHLAYMRFNDGPVPVYPIYWNDGQHGYVEKERYPQPGDTNPEVRIGITSVEDTATVWADFNEKDDQYFGMPLWTPAGALWVQWMNRDQNHLEIFNIDPSTGRKEPVYEERQPTWIDLDATDRVDFLPDNKGFLVKSDEDGWDNLYRYDMNGVFLNKVTTGNFWDTEIEKIDEKDGTIWFRARGQNATRFDLYRVGLDGKDLARVSFGDYSFDKVYISPKGKYYIAEYSNLSTPPRMALVSGKGKLVRELGDSKGPAFDAYALPRSELVRVRSTDSLFNLPMVITYPVHFDPHKKYPVLISIYGGPDVSLAMDRWYSLTGYGASRVWWAQEGLIQVTMDNRSSGQFGKKGMNYIFRQLGKYEIGDFMAGGRWLKKQPWVDSTKICITGGSFGGYMTCMALTYGADVFNYGVANSSVTDWQLYDTHYTERYMDMPKDNVEGYRNTSVMTYADRYKGLLRIIHGTSDDNVHMQNSMQLINKLEDLKKHFELMIYPGERHGIGGADPAKGRHNRVEAYKFYYDHLLDKPMPEAFWQ